MASMQINARMIRFYDGIVALYSMHHVLVNKYYPRKIMDVDDSLENSAGFICMNLTIDSHRAHDNSKLSSNQ